MAGVERPSDERDDSGAFSTGDPGVVTGAGMASNPTAITVEEFATWLLPGAALDLLNTALDDRTAKLAILKRLQHGLVRAVAQSASARENAATLVPLPAKEWKQAEYGILGSPLWRTGDMTIEIPMDTGYVDEEVPVSFFNVRFDPAGIRAMLPAAPVKPAPARQTADEPADINGREREKGPPVSDDHLRGWLELYRKAYQGPQDTLATAHKSAVGMFPGKFVARDRVRHLCGGRKVGRKRKA